MRAQSELRRMVGVLAAGALVLTGCSSQAASTAERGYISGAGTVSETAPVHRRPLPPITGRLIDGGNFDGREHRGEVLVYNVWGSWCPPCRREAPTLRTVWKETRGLGVQFVGIDVKDNDAAARAYERSFNITYPSIATEDSGAALLSLSTTMPPNAIPSTIIVDRNGRVAARILGVSMYTDLHRLVVQTATEGR